ncbi:alpha/beta fold hydrolase [Shimia ponticola]|uniref:alpha/beta fold hydrolase n=1 Tax=Shimia ponticola TaxID=2582893 RepID=UPI0011BD51D5|nr:alpha/beta fold hydrolase [Shimia ponticola]
MTAPSNLTTEAGRRIAYHHSPGTGPTIVFLGGFKSDMGGTKAVHLEAWCQARERAFLRFDYSGHGESDGAFEDGCIGEWAADARAVLEQVAQGPLLLIGSSMGGWISLLMAKALPERIAGMITIAAAPDFTEDGYWAGFSEDQRQTVMSDGRIAIPSDYGEPYIITRKLIEDGRKNLVLRDPLHLPFPVRFLQGTADEDVPMEWATKLLAHATGPDMRLVCLKDADHRFSDPVSLKLVEDAVENVLSVID